MRAPLAKMACTFAFLGLTAASAEMMEVIDIADGDTLNVRSGPGTKHSDIGDLNAHDFVNVLGTDASGKWAQIRYRGEIAWVSMKHLSSGMRPDGASVDTGPHVVTGIKAGDPDGGLMVRDGEGSSFAALGVLPNGTQVHVIERSADQTWAMIAYGPGVGWVSSAYLNSVAQGGTPPQPEPMPSADPTLAPDGMVLPGIFSVFGVAADDVLNIRSAPQASAQVVHQVTNGVPIEVLGMASGKWAKVQLGDTIGYAHMNYLKRGGGTTNMFGFQLDTECIGTEPFWRMTFDTDNMVRMTMMGEVATAAPLTTTTYSQTPTGYRYTFDAAPYSGQVNMEICSDGMSDNTYPMSILLTTPNTDGTPYTVHGCCRLQ